MGDLNVCLYHVRMGKILFVYENVLFFISLGKNEFDWLSLFSAGWVFEWSRYTACIQILREERGIHPINPFSSDFIGKIMRQIMP